MFRPPRLNGRYVVARLIGKGAQARVYLGFDLRLKQWRAVKVLGSGYLEDEHVRARFEQEAQAMARLSHPHLLRVVDVDHDGDTPYMVMELARGGALTEWMKQNGPVPPVLACRVARQCCDGLGHAHQVGVVHRDVKPHNVLIREDGSVAMSDFGIAQVAEGFALTQTGTIMGTFAFMAPEQRTDAKGVDHRADVYALGATLFTMLTGKTSAELFFAESRDAILRNVPELLRPVVLTACRYEREQRYESMAAMSEALAERMAQLPPDPTGVALASQLLTIPEQPPSWVDADAGVEDLVRALESPVPDEQPTLASLATPLPPLDGLFTPVPAPIPYRMPSRSERRRPAPLSRSSEEVPTYLDAVTDRPAPSRRPVKIDDGGARSLTEASPPRSGVRDATYWSLLASSVMVAALLAVVVSGIGAKVWTSRQLDAASRHLTQTIADHQPVIEALVREGADKEVLAERYFAVDDATPAERPDAAAAFASAVLESSTQLRDDSLAKTHVEAIRRALQDYRTAKGRQEGVAGSVIGRLSGTIGVY
ncbi:MAG: serine/threonine-protein kinase [Myxococcota bacterium]